MTFELTNQSSLRSSRGGFVLLFDEEKKHLALRPLSHLNTRELPREPFYPRAMGGARVPVQLSWSLALDDGSGRRWVNIRDGMNPDDHARVSVVLRRLPSGDVALALPDEGPALLKPHNPAPNGNKTASGARFGKAHVSKEALAVLNGEPPQPMRVRDLDVWFHVPEIAPLRGAETMDLIGKPGAPAILSDIQEYLTDPPNIDAEYDPSGIEELFEVSFRPQSYS